MTDIYDIKQNILWLPIDLFYSVVFVLFYIFFYIILSKYLNKDKVLKEEIIEKESITKGKVDYIEILEEIKNKYLNSSKEIFYSKLSEVIRLFLEENQEKPISKMTFEEIKSLNLEKNIENIIKDIYFKEFQKDIEDNYELRKKVLDEVKSLVK